MHPFTVLADPVRRDIVELLLAGSRSAGELSEQIGARHGISQPAVSQHLKVLRDGGFATVQREGARRIYALDPTPLRDLDAWLLPYRALWSERLDALGEEIHRGRHSPKETP